jgi:hypothetical protein
MKTLGQLFLFTTFATLGLALAAWTIESTESPSAGKGMYSLGTSQVKTSKGPVRSIAVAPKPLICMNAPRPPNVLPQPIADGARPIALPRPIASLQPSSRSPNPLAEGEGTRMRPNAGPQLAAPPILAVERPFAIPRPIARLQPITPLRPQPAAIPPIRADDRPVVLSRPETTVRPEASDSIAPIQTQECPVAVGKSRSTADRNVRGPVEMVIRTTGASGNASTAGGSEIDQSASAMLVVHTMSTIDTVEPARPASSPVVAGTSCWIPLMPSGDRPADKPWDDR